MPPLFLPMLLGWCAVWTVAAGIACFRGLRLEETAHRRAHAGFWGMTVLWLAINGGIGVWALLDPVTEIEAFRRLLLVNAGLDVGYLVTGWILLTRTDPLVRGFGRAILIQGAFLMVLDLGWWWWLGRGG